MTKNKFLKELDKSLYVLAESERQDIMNEYRDIIEEKMRHGKTEKEAVLEFGSIEELSREILSAYKVNPNFEKKEDDLKDSAKKLGNDFDNFVKKGAKKATDFTKEIVEEIKEKNQDITIEFVFELLFKSLATLIIMFLATIPFMIVKNIGISILEMIISPLDKILIVLWSLFITVLFIGCCFLIFIAMFKQYFKCDKKENKEDDKKNKNVKETKKEENKDNGMISTKKKVNKQEKVGTPLLDVFLALAKVVLVICMIPLVFFNIALIVGVVISIYLLIKGIMIPGVLVILIGLLCFFGYLQIMIFNIIFKSKKIHAYPYIIGIVLCVIGGVICFDQVMSLDYYDEAPKHQLQNVTSVDSKKITSDIVNFQYWDEHHCVKLVVNNTLPDNEVKLISDYYYGMIDKITFDHNEAYTNEQGKLVESWFFSEIRTNILSKEMKAVRKLMVDNFNQNKIYNYDALNNVNITIEANEKTSKKIMLNAY